MGESGNGEFWLRLKQYAECQEMLHDITMDSAASMAEAFIRNRAYWKSAEMVADCVTASLKARPKNIEIMTRLVELLDPTWRLRGDMNILSVAAADASLESALSSACAVIGAAQIRGGDTAVTLLGEAGRVAGKAREMLKSVADGIESGLGHGFGGLGLLVLDDPVKAKARQARRAEAIKRKREERNRCFCRRDEPVALESDADFYGRIWLGEDLAPKIEFCTHDDDCGNEYRDQYGDTYLEGHSPREKYWRYRSKELETSSAIWIDGVQKADLAVLGQRLLQTNGELPLIPDEC
jgi:hypothetical protein